MSFRDLFVDRHGDSGARLWSRALSAIRSGQDHIFIRGTIIDGAIERRYAMRVGILRGEDEFWREYYATARRMIAEYNARYSR